jgi:hypothetical protein
MNSSNIISIQNEIIWMNIWISCSGNIILINHLLDIAEPRSVYVNITRMNIIEMNNMNENKYYNIHNDVYLNEYISCYWIWNYYYHEFLLEIQSILIIEESTI